MTKSKTTLSDAKLTSEFVDTYKMLEAALALQETNVREYETALPEREAKRLQLCRLTRNFIVHDEAGFIVPSPAMLAFLKKHAEMQERLRKQVADIMCRVQAAKESEKMQDVARRIKLSRPFIPITDKDGKYLGIITADAIVGAVNKGALRRSVTANFALMTRGNVVDWHTPADDLPAGWVIAVDTATGKYKGVVYTEPSVKGGES